jgi:G:T/U-mismatch repair DNA glycosylase
LKIIMVGTITTLEGIERGFYYASGYNRFWNWMDLNIKNSSNTFLTLKSELANNNCSGKTAYEIDLKKKQIRDDFWKALDDKGIAVCDIIKSCWFSPFDSTKDACIMKNKSILYWDNEIINALIKFPKAIICSNSDKVMEILKCRNFFDKSYLSKKGLTKWNPNTQIIRIVSPSGANKMHTTPKGNTWKAVFDKYL